MARYQNFRREWRPVAAGTGSGPEGSRLTADIRRPWGNGAEDEYFGERSNVQSTDNMSPFLVILCLKSPLSVQPAMSVCLLPMQFLSILTSMRFELYGREGREAFLKGITQDFADSFAARGTNIKITWTTNLKDVAGSDIVVITAGTPTDQVRIVSIWRLETLG